MLPGELKLMRWPSESHWKIHVWVSLPHNGLLLFVSYSCWIKDDSVFYTSVVAYFCLIFLMNLSMFCTVLVQLNSINSQSRKPQRRTTLHDLKGTMSLTFLLGLTWGFAFFAWGPVRILFLYLFAIFNTLQGNFCFFVLSGASQTSTKALLLWKIISHFGDWGEEKILQEAFAINELTGSHWKHYPDVRTSLNELTLTWGYREKPRELTQPQLVGNVYIKHWLVILSPVFTASPQRARECMNSHSRWHSEVRNPVGNNNYWTVDALNFWPPRLWLHQRSKYCGKEPD